MAARYDRYATSASGVLLDRDSKAFEEAGARALAAFLAVVHGLYPVLPSLSIVIPAFNEAASIEASVRDALEVGVAHAVALEVVVCDDGSRDGTAAIAGAVTARDRRVVVLRRAVNRGIEASMPALYVQAPHAWCSSTARAGSGRWRGRAGQA